MTCSRLVLSLPSNSLCYREVVFSVKMRCSLEIVNEEYIEEVKDKSENETRREGQSTGRTFSKSGRMRETSKQI